MDFEEKQYLDLVKDVIQNGEKRSTRNGAFTRSLFGRTMTFDLKNNRFPLLTTKKVFFKGVVEELLWFLRGESDSKILEEKGVNIWKGHTSREHLDACGLFENEEGDAGPIYGTQWRNWDGIDQIANLITGLQKDPYGRRHILSAWNVRALTKMALPPCHILSQFYVSSEGGLSCQFYQRSADIGLGVPFNIASYALLTLIVASVSNLKSEKVICVFGDVHAYENHVYALEKQIRLKPYLFPTIELRKQLATVSDIGSLQKEDFFLQNYKYHPKVKMKMVV